MRQYLAFGDDGHDTMEFVFQSNHRANSKANLEDAKKELIKKYGFKRACQIKITETQRYEAY